MNFLIWSWLFCYLVESHSVFSSVLPEIFNLAATIHYSVRLLFKLMLTFIIINELMKKSFWSRAEDLTVQPRCLTIPFLCFSMYCTRLMKCHDRTFRLCQPLGCLSGGEEKPWSRDAGCAPLAKHRTGSSSVLSLLTVIKKQSEVFPLHSI